MAPCITILSRLPRAVCVFMALTLFSSADDQLSKDFELSVIFNASDIRADLPHFWRSTGFCPPQPHNDPTFDLSSDMVQNLAYIGALPHRAIKQVRVHWLLDLIKVKNISSTGPVYDLRLLDSLVRMMSENDLAIGFELMGSPSGLFTDFENKTQLYWFRDLVSIVATRYIEMFGLDYVKEWNFETWNEPDCHDFDRIKFTEKGFLNYYDACSEGLHEAHPSLTLGGPGDACWPDPHTGELTHSRVLFDALMNHTVRGRNYFTGKRGVRLDFIAIHEKGDAVGLKILEREINASKYINEKFPELADKPFYNDEADPLVSWSKPKEWRATAEYAGLIVKVIAQHQNILGARRGSAAREYLRNYALLSNDNGFLSYYPNQFTQRTLLARFQINHTSTEVDGVLRWNSEKKDAVAKPKQKDFVTFVRKPPYIVMGMLALLGEKQIHLDISKNGKTALSNTSDFGLLGTVHFPTNVETTSDSWQVTLLAFGATDPGKPKQKAAIDLRWYLDPPKSVKSLKMYVNVLWQAWGNPYGMWRQVFNSTKYPTWKELTQLREQENPEGFLIDVKVGKGFAPIPRVFEIEDPHVVIMHMCAKPAVAPEKVIGLRVINITAGQVMLTWSDRDIRTKCIWTYSVEHSPLHPDGPYKRINSYNIVVNVFLYETDSEDKVQGYYRVRAVDYFKQEGVYSDVASYTTSG